MKLPCNWRQLHANTLATHLHCTATLMAVWHVSINLTRQARVKREKERERGRQVFAPANCK